MVMAAAAQIPVSAETVGHAFVNQYYAIQHRAPELVHRFYQETSKLGRPEGDGPLSLTTTMQAINEKILSLNYGEFRAEIKSVDAQESHDRGVHVLVTGCLEGKDNMIQNFTQTFFLAPQERGYFVLNDMFQYVGKKYENPNFSPTKDVKAPPSPQDDDSPPVQVNHVQQTKSTLDGNAGEEESGNGEENMQTAVGEFVVVEEEVPVAEVVNEVPDSTDTKVESNSKTEETPKKSYASIVMVMKENPTTISSPTLRRPAAKSPERASLVQPSVSATETPAAFESVENGDHQKRKAEGYSVYIKGLPTNATISQVEDEFKRFGTIKYEGIQVRSKQGFCFGFVEFEEASAVEKAIEASPVMIGGREVYAAEKRSTNTGASHRGRYISGSGPGFGIDGTRGGRGNYGNSRGYNNHGDFNGRSGFGNRGNGYFNRGGDNYQSTASRANRGGGMVAKSVSVNA